MIAFASRIALPSGLLLGIAMICCANGAQAPRSGNPSDLRDPVSFSVYADSPYEESDEPAIRRYVALDRRRPGLDFMVHVGDIVDGFKDRDLPVSRLQSFAALFSDRAKPLFVSLGDNESNDLASPWTGLQRWVEVVDPINAESLRELRPDRGSRDPDLPGSYSFELKGVEFVGLTIPGAARNEFPENVRALLRERNLAWIRRAFRDANRKPVVVFCHAWPLGKNGLARDGNREEQDRFWDGFRTAIGDRGARTVVIHGDLHEDREKEHLDGKLLQVSIRRTSPETSPRRFAIDAAGTFVRQAD